ncbi:hypothetical protein ABT383_36715, partial [Streptomyces humidus]|uniref:hypothetical protein n=1 Tax=Streptomyces humidus TaxID=52259 RepID=UPI00332B10AC
MRLTRACSAPVRPAEDGRPPGRLTAGLRPGVPGAAPASVNFPFSTNFANPAATRARPAPTACSSRSMP